MKSHIDKVTEREGRLSRYRKYVWDVIRSSCIFKAGEGAPPLRITRCRPSDSKRTQKIETTTSSPNHKKCRISLKDCILYHECFEKKQRRGYGDILKRNEGRAGTPNTLQSPRRTIVRTNLILDIHVTFACGHDIRYI